MKQKVTYFGPINPIQRGDEHPRFDPGDNSGI
jgi:hypothetical protein